MSWDISASLQFVFLSSSLSKCLLFTQKELEIRLRERGCKEEFKRLEEKC